MNKNKPNYWKVASIILGIVVLSLLIYGMVKTTQLVDIDGFKIKKTDIDLFAKTMIDNGREKMKICNLDNSECIQIGINR